jgi:hypothetical protein
MLLLLLSLILIIGVIFGNSNLFLSVLNLSKKLSYKRI